MNYVFGKRNTFCRDVFGRRSFLINKNKRAAIILKTLTPTKRGTKPKD